MCRKPWFLPMHHCTIDATTKSTSPVTRQLLSVNSRFCLLFSVVILQHSLTSYFFFQTDTAAKHKNKLWNLCVKIMLSDKPFKGKWMHFVLPDMLSLSCTKLTFCFVSVIDVYFYVSSNFFVDKFFIKFSLLSFHWIYILNFSSCVNCFCSYYCSYWTHFVIFFFIMSKCLYVFFL